MILRFSNTFSSLPCNLKDYYKHYHFITDLRSTKRFWFWSSNRRIAIILIFSKPVQEPTLFVVTEMGFIPFKTEKWTKNISSNCLCPKIAIYYNFTQNYLLLHVALISICTSFHLIWLCYLWLRYMVRLVLDLSKIWVAYCSLIFADLLIDL